MRLLRPKETSVVSKRTVEKVMDQSDGKEAKRPALHHQQQEQQQQQQPPPPAQQWPQQQQQQAPYGAPGIGQQQQAQQYVQSQQQQALYAQQANVAGMAAVAAAAGTTFPQMGTAAAGVDPYRQQQLQQQQAAAAYASAATGFPQPYTAQQLYYQTQQQQQQQQALAAAQAAVAAAAVPGVPQYQQIQPQAQPAPPSYLQPKVGRLPADRPLIKLSVSLIDTYKKINTVYYEERDARRAARAKEKASKGQGANNNGWDDDNYDYIVTPGELFYGRYKMMERIGKGSFGQVVRAEDIETKKEVAIKIIKSKKPFLLQAKTEIELLTQLFEKDPEDQHNLGTSVLPYARPRRRRVQVTACPRRQHVQVAAFCFAPLPPTSSLLRSIPSPFLVILPLQHLPVRLLTHFMYRNHQCLVFEMLSLNLYELLKNTQFGGVSLNLIRKFAKQVLKALAFLARPDVDIIHCDLKPENILLRHPKKSSVKVIDFGSSCRSNKRMYSYIQSRFYRSPEVMLGLPYSTAIDMWSLGCILAEMHTGEPLFSGSDQFDQMQKIVKLLGMVPDNMLEKSTDHVRLQFFEKRKTVVPGKDAWILRQIKPGTTSKSESSDPTTETKAPIVPSTDPIASLAEVITAGSRQKKKYPPSEAYNNQRNYEMFIDLIYKMLAFRPEDRIKPADALEHPFIISIETTVLPAASSSS